ncbi:ubiquitin carboxyl-terminal hydrolase 23 isoform X2 [Tripterygium wilfordii]|uniref:ubiquitin carboxyl-terminal hydrolase 23 isoform X2 n=1 Tax=Tripterygium wilfordii TaxID=458696 RepID=UPI0018F851F8|nr:ubiquitin carboxyl-terminal hydrolase 23 isoform X2 [Tripterygium wilfordii]
MTELMESVEAKAESEGHSLFNRKIEFHPARKPFNGFSNGGVDFQIEILNPSSSDPQKTGSSSGQSTPKGKKMDGLESLENGLDPELISLRITSRRIGAGLENLGNTCFLNSVLQCLTYTEPLAAYLQSGKHQNSCRIAGFCALCAIQKHVSRALEATGRSLAPKDLVSNLRCISRNFRNARQEDAHEYMVNLLESMHKCCLPSGVPSESPSAYEKSLVHKIFGGRLRSQVKCVQCSYSSNKYDPFLDLSLEIIKADSLIKALSNFTAAELLDGGERQYQCQRCKQKVRALKQLTVHNAPFVLTVHLKRFRSHDPGQKIDKKVFFGPTLDMKPFVSGSYQGDLKYTLYGVLVHYGWSTRSGHYSCFVRTSSGMWYSLDDNRVCQVSERTVLEQKAYMLFYVRDRRDIVPRKPVDIIQKEISKPNLNVNQSCSSLNQPSKDSAQNGSAENGLCGASCVAESKKDAVIQSSSEKTIPKKEPFLHNYDQVKTKCLELKKGPIRNPSSTAPSPTKPSEVSKPDVGKDMPPLMFSVESNGNTPKVDIAIPKVGAITNEQDENTRSNEDLSVSATTSDNCIDPSNSATEKLAKVDSLQKISVSESAVSIMGPSVQSGDKTLDGISSPSGFSDKQMLEKIESNKGIPSEGTVSNPPGDQLMESTAVSVLTDGLIQKKPSDRRPRRKLKKCRIAKMHFGSKLFNVSLGIRKKKHKRRKGCSLDIHNKECLLDECLTSDLGPSTSEKSGKFSSRSSHAQKKGAKFGSRERSGIVMKGVESQHGDSLMDIRDKDLKDRICENVFNGTVRATDVQSQKISCSISAADQQHSTDLNRSNDSEREAVQSGMMNMLTRGLAETVVACWDGIQLSTSLGEESHNMESFRIGYIPDEWDEEYDRGKRKKIRGAKHEFSGPNPFQEIANRKAQLKKIKIDQSSSGNLPFRI